MPTYPENEALLDQFRGPGVCEYCRRFHNYRQAAHVLGKGMGGARRIDHRLNLVSLCIQCHNSHHNGNEPSADTLWGVVAKREKSTVDDVQAAINRIRRGEW
jgi:hypothetical protein